MKERQRRREIMRCLRRKTETVNEFFGLNLRLKKGLLPNRHPFDSSAKVSKAVLQLESGARVGDCTKKNHLFAVS